jgi:dienelactone hydrolase
MLHRLYGFWAVTAMMSGSLSGCESLADRTQSWAHHHGLTGSTMAGTKYRHEIYAARRAPPDVLYIFIEGDGSPWIDDGTRPARNPTASAPLALELAAQTPHSVLYLGRPCYLHANADSACTPEVWTSGRYSSDVVHSMVAVANRYATDGGFSHIVLIGYSGGGTLAVLMAPYMPSTRAVITIAANLDVDACTSWHHYRPLSHSLNPSTLPALDPRIVQLHLVGDRDSNVPTGRSARYLDTLEPGQVMRFEAFDHVCCWVAQWPKISTQLDELLTQSAAAHQR